MKTAIPDSESPDFVESRWKSNQRYWKRRFRPSLERLRSTQLREGSLYSNLRTLAPLVVLGLIWLWVGQWRLFTDSERVLGRSVTVRHLLLAFGIMGLWNLGLSLSLYTKRSPRKDLLAELARLLRASLVCGLLPLIPNLGRGQFSKGLVLAEWTTLGLTAVSFGLLGSFLVGAALSSRLLRRRSAIVVGTGRRAATLKVRLESHYSPFKFYGCVDNEYVGSDPEGDVYLGPISNLAELLKTHPIEVVLIGLPIKSKYDEIQRVIDICETVGVESHYMVDLFETSVAHYQTHSEEPSQFTVLSTVNSHPKQYIKRFLDFTGALILLALFSPVMLAVAIAVRLTSPGPVFFIQQRYGRHRQRFPMFKFRSMVVDAEVRQAALETKNEAQGPVFKLKSDPRVTPVGVFLRKTSLDELPQLFNVVRGEMSLVGPRPLPLRDVSRFEESWLLRRFSVRPGLTCLWQVNGRSNTSFDDWIKQDLTYIDQWSLGLDLKILFLTIPAVLRGSGAV